MEIISSKSWKCRSYDDKILSFDTFNLCRLDLSDMTFFIASSENIFTNLSYKSIWCLQYYYMRGLFIRIPFHVFRGDLFIDVFNDFTFFEDYVYPPFPCKEFRWPNQLIDRLAKSKSFYQIRMKDTYLTSEDEIFNLNTLMMVEEDVLVLLLDDEKPFFNERRLLLLWWQRL